MSDYNAGRARSEYILDDSKFDATYDKIVKQLNDLVNFKGTSNGQGAIDKQAASLQKLATEAAKTALTQQKLATETQKTIKTANDVAISEQKHAQSLQNTAKATAQAEAAQIRLQQTQARAARANANGGLGPTLPRSLEFFGTGAIDQIKSSFLSIAGPAAIITGAINGIGKAVESASAALELRETKNALFAVAGDMKTYNTILSEAQKQQVLFGGSLKDNIDGLSGLSILSKSTGANLSELIDVQKRLAVANSAQGSQGALIALTEALGGGQFRSLSRRFNIPTDEIKKLADTTLPVSERLAVVSKYLDKIGVSSDAVAGKVDQDAVAFRSLSKELGDLAINAGDRLATATSQLATGLARVVGVINGNPQAIAELKAIFNRSGPVTNNDVAQAGAVVNRQTAEKTLGATDSFFGTSAGTKLGDRRPEAEALLTTLASLGERAAQAGDKATETYNTTGQSTDEYIAKLRQLIQTSEIVAKTTNDSKDALLEELGAKVKSKIQTDALSQLQAQLHDDSVLAARGLLGAGDQALILADKYNLATQDAQKLIDAQSFIAGQGSKSTRLTARGSLPADTSKAGLLALAQGRQTTAEDIAASQAIADKNDQKAAQEAERIRKAQLEYNLSNTKSSGQRVALLREELAHTTDIVDRLNLQSEINRELNSGAKSHSKELDHQLATNEGIYDSLNKQKHAALDIQKLTIEDRQKSREEDRAIAKAKRVLNNPRFAKNAEAARDALDLININRQERQLDISDKIATAGGTIIDGKLRQSVQRNGSIEPIPAIAPTGASRATAANQVNTASSGAGVATLRLVDQAGRILADLVGPILSNDQLVTFQAVTSGGQGKAP